MAKTKRTLTHQQERLLDGLERHPKLMERFQSILDLAVNVQEDEPIRSADEIEALLVEQTRLLGKETLENWAMAVEQRVSDEYKTSSSDSIQQREKKL